MADDSFTEVTSQGFGSRILESIKGVLVGLAFFVGSFPLLWWNEGRAVQTAKSLEEGAGAVVSVPADRVDAGNQGKLLHVSGQATTSETLSDPDFGVSAANTIRLKRVVEMYQWKETEKSETKNKLGGGTETVKTYSYSKEWSDKLIQSGSFRQSDSHVNPPAMPYESREWTAQTVKLGAYTLAGGQVSRLDKADPVNVDGAKLAAAVAEKAKPVAGQNLFYVGKDAANPAIGDARVTFKAVKPADISVVARQVGETFEPYLAKAGGKVDLLEYGQKSADAMFQAAQAANKMLTWILRGGGFLLMFMGLTLVFKPIAVFGDVIPIVGTLLGAGLGLFSGLVAATLSLITIAIAWLAYRPLFGILLLVLAGGAVFGLKYLSAQRKKAAPAAA